VLLGVWWGGGVRPFCILCSGNAISLLLPGTACVLMLGLSTCMRMICLANEQKSQDAWNPR
jgi:hypothetical protein